MTGCPGPGHGVSFAAFPAMTIAVLTNAYPPTVLGGAGRIAQIYADLLEARGHDVRVIDLSQDFRSFIADGPGLRALRHLRDLRPRADLVQEILAMRPQALLTHNLTACGFGTPSAVVAKAGIPWVHVLHDVQLFEPTGQWVHGERHPLLRSAWRRAWALLRRRSLRHPSLVVSPTRWLLDAHLARGFFRGVPSEVVPNPVVAEAVPEGIVRDPSSVIFVGRVDRDKGAETLLAAWPALRGAVSRLTLVGGGEMESAWRRLGDEKVAVLGPRRPEEIRALMAAHGVLVLPSLVHENQPTVILEGLSAGCRVVAADVGGVAETLQDAGRLVLPGDPSALTATVRAAVQGEWPEALRAPAVLAQHDPARCVDALERCLSAR